MQTPIKAIEALEVFVRENKQPTDLLTLESSRIGPNTYRFKATISTNTYLTTSHTEQFDNSVEAHPMQQFNYRFFALHAYDPPPSAPEMKVFCAHIGGKLSKHPPILAQSADDARQKLIDSVGRLRESWTTITFVEYAPKDEYKRVYDITQEELDAASGAAEIHLRTSTDVKQTIRDFLFQFIRVHRYTKEYRDSMQEKEN